MVDFGDGTNKNSNYFKEMMYKTADYEEKIKLHVGETFELTDQNFKLNKNYLNVYKQDKEETTFVDKTTIIDSKIANYENGLITANRIGKTLLHVNHEEITIYIPVEVLPEGADVVPDVEPGDEFNIALRANGEIWSFGKNKYGELGLGDNLNRNYPEKIIIDSNEKITDIAVGTSHTVAIGENFEIYTWGKNANGELGTGNTQNIGVPQKSDLELNKEAGVIVKEIPVKVYTKPNETYILMQNGNVYACGENIGNTIKQLETYELDLGNKEVETNEIITKLLEETNETAIKITKGTNHTAVALTNGAVYTWGEGEEGQLGDGANENSDTPKKVGQNIIKTNTNNLILSQNQNFDLIGQVSYFNLLKDITGNVRYESKDLEIVTVDEVSGHVIAQRQGKTTIIAKEDVAGNIAVIQVNVLPEGVTIRPQVKTNGNHTITLKSNGTVWSYGQNTNGELGNGNNDYSDDPQQAIFPERSNYKTGLLPEIVFLVH